VDLADPRFPAALANLRSAPGGDLLVGYRQPLYGEAVLRQDWLRAAKANANALSEAGCALELLTDELHTGLALRLAAEVDGAVVVDHLGSPPIGGAPQQFTAWRSFICELGGLANTYVKLSGVITWRYRLWPGEELRRFSDIALENLGPRHIMIGSNWPHSAVSASYRSIVDRTMDCLRDLSVSELSWLWRSSARAAYRLDSRDIPRQA
jgi:L-fuconolactonase